MAADDGFEATRTPFALSKYEGAYEAARAKILATLIPDGGAPPSTSAAGRASTRGCSLRAASQ